MAPRRMRCSSWEIVATAARELPKKRTAQGYFSRFFLEAGGLIEGAVEGGVVDVEFVRGDADDGA
jgi:hypothetical protein